MNKVILTGHVGKDPEVQYLDSGIAVANMSLATSEFYKDKQGQRITKTEWHNIVLWRGLAETAEKFVKKGSHLTIEGKIRTRSYDKNGETRYITEIFADGMELLGRKEGGNESSEERVRNQTQKAGEVYLKDIHGGVFSKAGDLVSSSVVADIPADNGFSGDDLPF